MNKKRWVLPTIFAVALVIALGWGYNQYKVKNEYKISLTNNYQRLLYDVKDHVENVQVSLSKALASGSNDQNILLLSKIVNESYFAQDKLSQMPVSHSDISKTEKFLTQVADYSYSLIQDHLDGQDLNSKQRQTLFDFQNYSSYFNKELSDLHDKIVKTNFDPKKINSGSRNKLEKVNRNMIETSLGSMEKQIAKTPELIYDGPFSEQILNKKPVGLGKGKVDLNQAKTVVKDFLGDKKIDKITEFEEGKNVSDAQIPSYTFSIASKNTPKELAMYMGVSKVGGKTVWMVNPRASSGTNITINDAQKRALKFLEQKGFPNMEPNYYLRYDGTILFNFAYKQDNVTIYPDLIKVKVALDDGEIVGFDASSYLMSHYDRKIAQPNITIKEARKSVRIDFEIENVRLAIIPKGKQEILCYEFKGKYKDSDFIIYINALNGKEEEILQIIKSENGTLTF